MVDESGAFYCNAAGFCHQIKDLIIFCFFSGCVVESVACGSRQTSDIERIKTKY